VADLFDDRALNRATLARQLLLARTAAPADETIERLVGLQAQEPRDPYVALWSRLEGFRPEELSDLLAERRAVRTIVMRGTIHLVTARDCKALRPLFDGVAARVFGGTPFARNTAGVDKEELLAAARELLEQEPRTRADLGRLLAGRWPDVDPTSLANAVGYLMPGIQIPPRGLWGKTGRATWATTESWLGRRRVRAATPAEVVLRYLAAFGPASVRDATTWSGLTGLRAVFETVRARLVTFRSESGVELFDLPDAPRPDPETPAPVRFLPEYDNVLLGFHDRTRFRPEGLSPPFFTGEERTHGTVLVDGTVRGRWRLAQARRDARLRIEVGGKLTRAQSNEVVEEGDRLLTLLAPGAGHEVELT
jgi:hypothetical protein